MDRALAVDGRVGRPGRIVARRLLDERAVLAGLVIVALTFGALIGPQFFAAANLELMARQTVIVCIAALLPMIRSAGSRPSRRVFRLRTSLASRWRSK